jgi:hypothetical protein
MNALPLIRDMRLERRIKHLANACTCAYAAGDREAAAIHWEQMRLAIAERSRSQVARMESRMGLRARRKVKSALMIAFCHGWIPAAAVAPAFQLFQLHGV